MQHLEWKNLKWVDGDPTTAAYACNSCGVLIEERYKTQMLLAGQWRAHAKSSDKKRSYHLNSLYSPLGWKSWASIVEDFIKAKDDPPALKTWVNTTLGETWEDNYSATLDPQNLMGRCEDYSRLSVPEKVLFCTMGVDVQDDRIEATLYGWAEGEEAWKLEHFVVYGDPSMPEIWNQLTEIRRSEIRREDGHYLTIECCAIDSGGHHTQQVYQYAKENRAEWVIAVKGSSIPGKPTIGKPSKVDFKLNGNTMKNGAELYIVGSNSIKTIIYSRLRKQEFGPGSYHFPKSATHDFFEQLTAEKQQVKYLNGMPSKIWVKKNGARNEALDTAVYAYAALNHVYLRLNKHTLWQQFRDLISNRQIQTTPQPPVPVAMLQQDVIVRKKSSFWS
jgi:phage terminase large subunit GpA-like protein